MQRRFALTAMASMTKAVAEQRPQEL